MTKLKQGDAFTDKKGNEYRYGYDSLETLEICIHNVWVDTDFSDSYIIELTEQGELIPVKPKTVADEMLEWVEEKKANGLIRLSIDDVCDKLSELLAKHEEKQ